MIPTTAYLLLDTNILLLLLVMRIDLDLLFTFKRMNSFEVGDHEILNIVIGRFRHLITTPHVLAEVSNFVDQSPPPQRQRMISALRRFAIEQQEHYELAAQLVTRKEFDQLGIADTGLLSLSSQAMVLTSDAKLYARILGAGGHAMNFNHLREETYRKKNHA